MMWYELNMVVFILQESNNHRPLWFETGTSTPDVDIVNPLKWCGPRILTQDGRPLAILYDWPDDWYLVDGYAKPCLEPWSDPPLGAAELTFERQCLIEFYLPFLKVFKNKHNGRPRK